MPIEEAAREMQISHAGRALWDVHEAWQALLHGALRDDCVSPSPGCRRSKISAAASSSMFCSAFCQHNLGSRLLR